MTINEFDKWKQYIGYMIKFIMEKNGYIHAGRNIAIKTVNGEEIASVNTNKKKGKRFSNGSKYKKYNKDQSKRLSSLDPNDKEQMKALSELLKKEGIDDSWIEKFLGNNATDSKEWKINKIYLHEDLTGETFEWNLDVEMFESIQVKNTEDLRELLISKDVGILDLKYLDTSNNNQSELSDFNIIVWNFNDNHFDWLINEEPGKIKFVEVINKR